MHCLEHTTSLMSLSIFPVAKTFLSSEVIETVPKHLRLHRRATFLVRSGNGNVQQPLTCRVIQRLTCFAETCVLIHAYSCTTCSSTSGHLDTKTAGAQANITTTRPRHFSTRLCCRRISTGGCASLHKLTSLSIYMFTNFTQSLHKS